mgnify:CR=1 FL=1
MLKKFIVVCALIALLALSFVLFRKTKTAADENVEPQEVVNEVQEAPIPEQVFSFNKDNLPENCTLDDGQFCAVEKAVKCTLNPDFADCAKSDLPKFIFMQDPSVERPTEMNYKIVDRKSIGNNSVEIYTESTCNGNWFGLCQGTIIYVLGQKPENVWYLKDIYAIE